MIGPRERIGQFMLEEELGRGGQSVVYLARDTELDRNVALKVFWSRASVDGDGARRFRREAEILSRLDEPAICAIHDADPDGDPPWIAMRHVEGRSLTEPPEPCPPTAINPLLRVFEQVAEALHAAHEAGVVHRDLKPANVMITTDGEPVVLDFGLAHDDRQPISITLSGDVFGTPVYMAPEQIRSDRVDRRTDVYGLGATLYECLTGRPPFEAATRAALYPMILFEEPTAPRTLNPAVSVDANVIVLKAMAKEPRLRYQTGAALAADLRRAREGRPITARRAGPAVHLRRWVRRNPTLAGGAAGLAVVLLAALLTITGLERRERRSLLERTLREDLRSLPALAEEARQPSWSIASSSVPLMDAWLDRADSVLRRRTAHANALDEMRASALAEDGSSSFDDPRLQREHDDRQAFLVRLDELAELADQVRERREDALTIRARSIVAYRSDWDHCIAEIADRARNPHYDGLTIRPQLGLVPIGQDPRSGLFEFAHVLGGTIPQRDRETGRLVPTTDTTIVLVLIPGGRFMMGAAPPDGVSDTGRPNVDPDALLNERPVHEITLAPYFISKYEMTYGQWMRITGDALHLGPPGAALPEMIEAHPAAGASWDDVHRVMRSLGLDLPTEAQWEHAARGGTTTPWWTGSDPDSLPAAANIMTGDSSSAVVGSLAANPFGLHDVHGNASEMVRDWSGSYELPVKAGDGERMARGAVYRVARDVASGALPAELRVSARKTEVVVDMPIWHGWRPSRRLEPGIPDGTPGR